MVKVPSGCTVAFEVYVFPDGLVKTPETLVFGAPVPKTSITSIGRYTAWSVCAVNADKPLRVTEPEL